MLPEWWFGAVLVSDLRTNAEAFLRLCTLAGEEAQVDWGHFGQIEVGCQQQPIETPCIPRK